ncbi:MAG: YchJ family protein [Deltaproteobacteria bacterium]|nr:YchJ family protein [Deltaproteobacteria bacterium]
MNCPCGSGQPLADCCKPYIKGKKKPPTPEAVMRARYTAYATNETQYILTSNAPETSEDVDLEATKQWAKKAEWEGFEIVDSQMDEGGERAELEFIARYSIDGQSMTHHELSTFVKLEDGWYFLDGDAVKPKPIRREGPKIGRNDPCPCGSGKKYKKCCAA